MQKRTHELDFRADDGLEVSLLWNPESDRVTVSVFDAKTGDDFPIDVDPADALDAFHHPTRMRRITASTSWARPPPPQAQSPDAKENSKCHP